MAPHDLRQIRDTIHASSFSCNKKICTSLRRVEQGTLSECPPLPLREPNSCTMKQSWNLSQSTRPILFYVVDFEKIE